jgi:hypothetical protein
MSDYIPDSINAGDLYRRLAEERRRQNLLNGGNGRPRGNYGTPPPNTGSGGLGGLGRLGGQLQNAGTGAGVGSVLGSTLKGGATGSKGGVVGLVIGAVVGLSVGLALLPDNEVSADAGKNVEGLTPSTSAVPPFTGGQNPSVEYWGHFDYVWRDTSGNMQSRRSTRGWVGRLSVEYFPFNGAGFSGTNAGLPAEDHTGEMAWFWRATDASGNTSLIDAQGVQTLRRWQSDARVTVQIFRADGLPDTSGSPSTNGVVGGTSQYGIVNLNDFNEAVDALNQGVRGLNDAISDFNDRSSAWVNDFSNRIGSNSYTNQTPIFNVNNSGGLQLGGSSGSGGQQGSSSSSGRTGTEPDIWGNNNFGNLGGGKSIGGGIIGSSSSSGRTGKPPTVSVDEQGKPIETTVEPPPSAEPEIETEIPILSPNGTLVYNPLTGKYDPVYGAGSQLNGDDYKWLVNKGLLDKLSVAGQMAASNTTVPVIYTDADNIKRVVNVPLSEWMSGQQPQIKPPPTITPDPFPRPEIPKNPDRTPNGIPITVPNPNGNGQPIITPDRTPTPTPVPPPVNVPPPPSVEESTGELVQRGIAIAVGVALSNWFRNNPISAPTAPPVVCRYDAAQVERGVTAANAANTTATAGNTILTGEVITRLGDPLTGGISGSLGRLTQNLALDRWLGVINNAVLLHNAMILSSNLPSSLGFVVDNILNIAGWEFQDANGQSIGFSTIVNAQIQNLFRTVLGDDTYEEAVATWRSWNNLIRTASNLYRTTLEIFDTTRDTLETLAENTGKVGNALKRFLVVPDSAYGWMPETSYHQNRFSRGIQKLTEGIQAGTEMLNVGAEVTENIIEIQELQQEFKQNKDDAKKALETFQKETSDREEQENKVSKPPEIDFKDLIKPEENE